MKINKIWTIKVSEDRYIHNATFVGDNTMYALFHNGGYNCYEYWKLTRDGDSWKATLRVDSFLTHQYKVLLMMVITSTSALTIISLK